MLLEEITKDIISDAMVALNELKPGLYEKLYEKALVVELLARGHVVESRRESASGRNQLTSGIWHEPESRLVQIGESP